MAIRVYTREHGASAFVEAANQSTFNATVRLAIATALRSYTVTDCLVEDDAAGALSDRLVVVFVNRAGREPSP